MTIFFASSKIIRLLHELFKKAGMIQFVDREMLTLKESVKC